MGRLLSNNPTEDLITERAKPPQKINVTGISVLGLLQENQSSLCTMAATKQRDPSDISIVHQNAIHVETILKEHRTQKLYTEFSINPYKKLHVLTDKPISKDSHEEVGDPAFLTTIHRARLEPTKKYTHPQTESQELGWISTPLLVSDRSDRRLNFPRQNSEITKYMDAAWRLKEQTQNLG